MNVFGVIGIVDRVMELVGFSQNIRDMSRDFDADAYINYFIKAFVISVIVVAFFSAVPLTGLLDGLSETTLIFGGFIALFVGLGLLLAIPLIIGLFLTIPVAARCANARFFWPWHIVVVPWLFMTGSWLFGVLFPSLGGLPKSAHSVLFIPWTDIVIPWYAICTVALMGFLAFFDRHDDDLLSEEHPPLKTARLVALCSGGFITFLNLPLFAAKIQKLKFSHGSVYSSRSKGLEGYFSDFLQALPIDIMGVATVIFCVSLMFIGYIYSE